MFNQYWTDVSSVIFLKLTEIIVWLQIGSQYVLSFGKTAWLCQLYLTNFVLVLLRHTRTEVNVI